jgi:hypothetical protein
MFSFGTTAMNEVYSSETLSYLAVFSPLRKCGRPIDLGQMRMSAPLVHWFQQQPRETFAEGSHQLVCKKDACLDPRGDYF